ncbi:hypothetical protein [Pseudomonas asiatica]|uniref:hypothetical protein n=1 Tax=Pseudomonas asiatica TaxID=2219225 RepID=UPI0037C967D9
MGVILNADGLDEWLERPAPGLPQTPEALVERALQMGIVGLGGAGFPTASIWPRGAAPPISASSP